MNKMTNMTKLTKKQLIELLLKKNFAAVDVCEEACNTEQSGGH